MTARQGRWISFDRIQWKRLDRDDTPGTMEIRMATHPVTTADRPRFTGAIPAVLLLLVCACGGGYYLDLGIRMTGRAPTAPAGVIRLAFADERTDHAVFSPAARQAYPYFSERYRLSTETAGRSDPGSEKVLDLESLFMELFRRRCNALGYAVSDEAGADAPCLTVRLKTFRLDLQGRRWRGRFECDLAMAGPGRRNSVQHLSVNGERFRPFGRKGAGVLMGDILSEGLDKTDIAALIGSK